MALRNAYRGKNVSCVITSEERMLAEELGLLEKGSVITEFLRVAKILKANGVNLAKIKLSERKEGKQKKFKLSEIEQEEIDIGKIIEENRFRSRFSLWG